jgi:indolepyruvate ferredoxin oxidoreductase, beta subunit
MDERTLNVVVAGLGGQGVIKASDILADAAFRAGLDVKKSEIHGMSQRGGSVSSDVRFGGKVLSPMVPPGQADYLLVLAPDQVDNSLPMLRKGGVLIRPDAVDEKLLENRRSMNVALLGALAHYLPIPQAAWEGAIRDRLAPKLHDMNLRAFALGRKASEAAAAD